MGDLDKNIHRKDNNPYGEILTHSIERDKEQKEESYPFTQDSQLQFFSAISSFFQQLIQWIGPHTHSPLSLPSLKKTLEDAKNLRKLLAALAGEDCSHNPIFNQQLSELWHNLQDDCNSLPTKEPYSLSILNKIKFLISQIKNFPIESEYTLGYYLAEHVGSTWIPFPCMKLLQELHEEFLKTPSRSTLHRWILLLDEISLLTTPLTRKSK